MVRRPGVFLMDEPLSNLDAKLRIEARSFLAKMHHEIGTTTIYVTHDQSEAMTMGDTIVVMKDGMIQQAAPPLEVYNEPANMFVAGFIGSPAMNFLELSKAGSKLVDKEQELEFPVSDRLRKALDNYRKPKVMLGLRPDALRPAPRDAEPAGAPRFSIDVAQHLGHETLLDASRGPHRLVARVPATDDSKIGETRAFLLDLDKMHLFDLDSGANLASNGARSERALTVGYAPSSLTISRRPLSSETPIGSCLPPRARRRVPRDSERTAKLAVCLGLEAEIASVRTSGPTREPAPGKAGGSACWMWRRRAVSAMF